MAYIKIRLYNSMLKALIESPMGPMDQVKHLGKHFKIRVYKELGIFEEPNHVTN